MSGLFHKFLQAVHRHPTGRRFQNRYEAARAARKDARWTQRALRVLLILVAVIATLIGVILAFVPGPAIPFFILAGGLLSAESRAVARLLDWGEGRMWALWGWGQRQPVAARYAMSAVFVGLGLAVAYTSYRFMRS